MKPAAPIQSFVLNGKRYRFAHSQVAEAVKNQPPRRIDKYKVAVEGVEYPPKQVVERLTGVEPINFTTMDAQRILKKLGYVTDIARRSDGGESVEDRNLSEQYFEYYLQTNGYHSFEYQPTHAGTTRKPDYRLTVGSEQILLEVKEFTVSKKDFSRFPDSGVVRGGAFDPYAPIRQKIDYAREQFNGLKDAVCCLVLFNENKPLVDLNWQMIYGAMLGNITWNVPFNPTTQEFDDSQTTTGFGRNGKCSPSQNRTISAVIVLEALMLGERRFRCHMSRAMGDKSDHKLSWDEIFELERLERDKARGTERDSAIVQWRVIVHENPWARNKLSRSLFCGRFDERFGDPDESGSIRRIFAGDAVLELESLEQECPASGAGFRRLISEK